MDSALPSLLIGALMLLASAFLARGGIQSYDQLGGSLRNLETRIQQQNATRLSVTATSLDGARDTLTVNLRNDGQIRLAAYHKLDVIVTYYTSASARLTVWVPWSEAVTPGAWRLASILNDAYEPGILNPGETAEIQIELGSAVHPGATNLIVIGSEIGSPVSVPFSS
jgi:archaellum component FlaF (FlaF/FlaG flagellin family)